MFFRRPVYGPRRAFARRSVPDQSGGLRLDRDANDYRPGDGDDLLAGWRCHTATFYCDARH